MSRPLLYGAYGYTGELVAREAVAADLDPILAGRREAPLRELAADLGADYRVAALPDLEDCLDATDAGVLLHCAGPFADTYRPAVEACLATGTHYLDITGEVPVFEALRAEDDRARERGVLLLPGAGFDVVPSDCLAARLHEALPEAKSLTLALAGLGEVSPGTARTATRVLAEGVLVREGGTLRRVGFGERTREIDTGTGYGRQQMAAIPWADVATAYHTTGIPSVAVYAPSMAGLSPSAQRLLGLLRPALSVGPVRRGVEALADRLAEGPDAAERASGDAFFWGEVRAGGRRVTGRVHTTETYRFTAAAMVEVARRVLDGDAPVGYQTPASAYGWDLVTAVEGCRFEAVGEVEPS